MQVLQLQHTARKHPLIVTSTFQKKHPQKNSYKSNSMEHICIQIQGSREDTAQAAGKHAQTIYYASHYWNPYFFHGTKTCIFEIVEQLGWKSPDILIVPVGNGTLLYGCIYRFKGITTRGYYR